MRDKPQSKGPQATCGPRVEDCSMCTQITVMPVDCFNCLQVSRQSRTERVLIRCRLFRYAVTIHVSSHKAQHTHTHIDMHRRMRVPCAARQCLGTATGLGGSTRATLRKMRPHTARTWAVCAEGRSAKTPSPFLSTSQGAAPTLTCHPMAPL